MVVVVLGDEADWKITACEGGVVSIPLVSEVLLAEAPMPAYIVNGVLGKKGAEWKMRAWEGGVMSIVSESDLLPVEAPMPTKAIIGVLGKTGAEWKMTA